LKGLLGLQLHAGPAMRAEFKNIELLKLKPKSVEEPVSWIWSQEKVGDQQRAFFRRDFEVPAGVSSATIVSSCDNFHRLWLNGVEVGMSGNCSVASTYDVMPMLRPGEKNMIAVEGRNEGSVAGLAVLFSAVLDDGSRFEIASNSDGLVSSSVSDEWWKPGDSAAVGDVRRSWRRWERSRGAM
jgi:hypothetical protein